MAIGSSRAGRAALKAGFIAAVLLASTAAVFAEGAGGALRLSLTPGGEWSHAKRFGPVKVTLTPQIAVWLKRADGSYVADLFVTEKAGKSAWGKVRRPEALPVWSHDRGVRYPDGLFMPTKADPLPDAVSGATPKPKKGGDRIELTLALPADLPAGDYLVAVEVNSSFDFNAAYPETKENVNGQPSVVYGVPFVWGASPAAGTAALLGTGHPAGADGAVRPGSAGLDSALRIVEEITLGVAR